MSKGFEYGAENPIKETTSIEETYKSIYITFHNKKPLQYDFVKVTPFENGINYTVEINGNRKIITKSKEPSGSFCFSLEHEWMITKIFKAYLETVD
jgi:hypothetical protein